MARIKDKKEEIQNFLEELGGILPLNFEDYMNDSKTRAACERYFEKIIGATIDLAFILAKERNLKFPEEEKAIFDILANEGIISQDLSSRLKEAKGMRNILVHDYGRIDDEIVFESLTQEIIKDVGEFLYSF